MKNKIILFSAIVLMIVGPQFLAAQENIIKKNGYTLTFKNNAPNFSPQLQERLINTFFEVYPVLGNEYNASVTKEVTFVIDTAYKGVAATSKARVVFNPVYMESHPEDIDVVTHEVMHIVQGYGKSSGPVWLTEGIADFVRNKYGINNTNAKWVLPDYKTGQSYTNSYRITARFFTWIEEKIKPGTIKEIDASLRNHTYKVSLWKEITGNNLDELWINYANDPSLI